jgi:hypothetical protein
MEGNSKKKLLDDPSVTTDQNQKCTTPNACSPQILVNIYFKSQYSWAPTTALAQHASRASDKKRGAATSPLVHKVRFFGTRSPTFSELATKKITCKKVYSAGF